MGQGFDALTGDEKEQIKRILLGLVKTLKAKRAVGSAQNALTDETIVLNALEHPERGDIEIIVLRENTGLDVFLSNRREAESPFSVMDSNGLRRHPGRRPVDNAAASLKEGDYGIFLLSIQDRDLLRQKADSLIRAFSHHFGIAETPNNASRSQSDLRQKPLEQCTYDEKWQILTAAAPGDNRLALIQKEFFEIQLNYARYKQPEKTESLLVTPENYKETIGQLIRDCYPYGIRVSLRRDYPKEHKALLDKVHAIVRSMENEVRSRAKPDFPSQVRSHLIRVSEYLRDIVENDPELSRVV